MKKRFFSLKLIDETSGFTMVELVVALAVFAILTAVITPIFKQGSGFWESTQSKVELRQNLNPALELMAKTLRQAAPNTVSGTGNTPATQPGETVLECTVDGSSRNFLLKEGAGGAVYLELNSEPVTSTTLIKITEAQVSPLDSGSYGYKIAITGRYLAGSAVNDADKELKVETTVFLRQVPGVESWRELN